MCAELDKNPPSTSDHKFTVSSSENSNYFEKLFAAADRINNQIVPGIKKAIVEKDGPNITLNRNLTQKERTILSNLTDDMFLNLNTFNYAVWAITDGLDKNKMQEKLLEWSGRATTQGFDVQIDMTRIILEEAVLNEYAVKFE